MPVTTRRKSNSQLKASDITAVPATARPRMRAVRPTSSETAFQAPPTPAADNVFNTNELLEMILLKVDIKTLLLSQRVDKTWRTIITGSKNLQKKLFFLPATRDELSRLNLVEESKVVDESTLYDPEVSHVFRDQRSYNIFKLGFWPSPDGPRKTSNPSPYNPLLLQQAFYNTALPVDELRLRQCKHEYENSSWKRMLLFQSAPNYLPNHLRVDIWEFDQTWPFDDHISVDIRQPLGDLVARVEDDVPNECGRGLFPQPQTAEKQDFCVYARNGKRQDTMLAFRGFAVTIEEAEELET